MLSDVHSQQESNLSDYEGKVVILNFWATWCAPCLDEIPDLNRLQREYADDLVILSVSDEDRQLLVDFEQQLPLETHSKRVAMGVGTTPAICRCLCDPPILVYHRQGRSGSTLSSGVTGIIRSSRKL